MINARHYTEEKLNLYVIMLFLTFRIIDAPVRYFLAKSGLSLFSVLPNILIIGLLSLHLFKSVYSIRVRYIDTWLLIIFVYSIFIGFIYIADIKQVMLGLYSMLPLFFGFLRGETFIDNFERLDHFIFFLWLVAVLGVFVSVFVTFPWVGFSYDQLGVEVEGTREWTTLGIQRVAGFSRVSFEAAISILTLSLMLNAVTTRILFKIIIMFVSGVAIFLTTTKAIIFSYFVVVVFLFTRTMWRVWLGVILLFISLMVLLPLSTFIVKYDLGISDQIVRVFLLSFEDRLVNTWPNAFNLLNHEGSFIFGRGIGGIGGAQVLFEKSIQNPADNLFVYLYFMFGLGSIAVLFIFFKRIYKLIKSIDSPINMFLLTISITVITFGITANVIEAPLYGFIMGIIFAKNRTL